jgi:hypothetical protein
MISGHLKPETAPADPPSLVLEIAGEQEPTPYLIPVLAQNLVMEGITVAVINPWVITDWDSYRGRDCVLRVAGSGGQPPETIQAKISWFKFGGDINSPLSVGLNMINPSGEALQRLSDHINHPFQDIRGLWEKYDQMQKMPTPNLMDRFYLAGIGLLIGGVVLQLVGSPGYKSLGWVLWLLGTLGIAIKVFGPFRQKRVSQ